MMSPSQGREGGGYLPKFWGGVSPLGVGVSICIVENIKNDDVVSTSMCDKCLYTIL